MLSISRRAGERTHLILPSGERVVIELVEVDRGKVKLRFDAPASVKIWREELLTRVQLEN